MASCRHYINKSVLADGLIKCDDNFQSPEQQADSLVFYMKQAMHTKSADKKHWEQQFFCAFPNSFEKMQAVFGYDMYKGASPLYFKGKEVIEYFGKLESIPDFLYYEKYISINIDGVWEADNIRAAFGFHKSLMKDPENACKALSKFTDNEIKSVYRFIFDGPHPINRHNKKLYEKLKLIISVQNSHLGHLLTDVYLQLMREQDVHIH